MVDLMRVVTSAALSMISVGFVSVYLQENTISHFYIRNYITAANEPLTATSITKRGTSYSEQFVVPQSLVTDGRCNRKIGTHR